VDEALEITGLKDFQKRPSYLLSAGETQRLALAGVLAMQPRCIIFDETTAMLDPAGRQMVMQQIREFHRQGLTTILITHLMEEAVQADRVIVLDKGRLMLDDSPGRIFTQESRLEKFGLDLPQAARAAESLRKYFPGLPSSLFTPEELLQSLPAYTGKDIASAPANKNRKDKKEHLIHIKDLSYTYLKDSPLAHQALDHLTMQVSKGSIHSLIGRTGSGKSTILQHINGLMRPQAGSVHVAQFDLSDAELDIKALRRKTALAFQQPEDQFFEQYVGDEIAYAPRHLGYSGKLKDVVQRAMQAVDLDFETFKDRLTSTLSGGEKRKVALASILAIEADILLLDEPLSGLDPFACRELIKLFTDLNQKGKTILVSTHQYEELIPILDNVSVVYGGKDALQGRPDEVFSQTQKLEEVGLKAPLGTAIINQLVKNKWPIDPQTVSLPAIEKQLAAISAGGGA
jgi:energy-coupling factor transport system ATP-binding protein